MAEKIFRELEVHQLYLGAGGGVVTQKGGEHHGKLGAEVYGGVGDLDEVGAQAVANLGAQLAGRGVQNVHHTAHVRFTHLVGDAGNRHPCAHGLPYGHGFRFFHHVHRRIQLDIVGGQGVILVPDVFRENEQGWTAHRISSFWDLQLSDRGEAAFLRLPNSGRTVRMIALKRSASQALLPINRPSMWGI